jgi:competence protein ComEC
VGQGDAAVVELPSAGPTWVVDGGGLGGVDPGERVVVPRLWADKVAHVDAIVMSHPESDHIGGLVAVAQRFAPREFWSSGGRSQSATFARLESVLAEQSIRRRTLARGAVVHAPDPSGEAIVLHPDPPRDELTRNDGSLVLAVRYGASRVLFSGDIEARAEREMGRRGLPLAATIIKVPHHGSRTSSTAAFLDAVRPGVAIAMLGFQNRFGFPSSEVLSRYALRGAEWLGTDVAGEVTVESDGQLETVQTCRER